MDSLMSHNLCPLCGKCCLALRKWGNWSSAAHSESSPTLRTVPPGNANGCNWSSAVGAYIVSTETGRLGCNLFGNLVTETSLSYCISGSTHHKTFSGKDLQFVTGSKPYIAIFMADNKPGSAHSAEQVVLDEVKGHIQIITLNNPRKRNNVTREVALRLAELYEKWEKENDAEMIIIKGTGQAFCAGGDLRSVYYGKAEKHNIEVMYKIYWLYYHIHTYKKTLVAFVNGIAMGSGASLATLSAYKVVTEKTVFAAPEVGFGFHTESGLSYILSHLSGHLGEYLALTGSRLDGVEMITTGLGTHYIPSEKLEELEKRLIDLNTGDKNLVRATIEEFTLQVQPGEKSILHNSSLIDKCFSNDTVEDIIESLAAASDMEGNEWVKGTIKKLKSSSPTALKMTLRSVRQARKQTLFECLKKEFRVTVNTFRGVISKDIYEGIRALIIEKDNFPKWNPPLGEVTEEKLNLLFKPLEEEFELQLPIEGKMSRWEGKFENSGYNTKYPHDCEVHPVMTQVKSRM